MSTTINSFGDYAQFDLIGEHSEWIYMTAPAQEGPNTICEGGGKCPTTNPFKNEWIVNLTGSKWYLFFSLKIHNNPTHNLQEYNDINK